MTSTNLGYKKAFSELTWAIFRDSGWYVTDSTFADKLKFGYKEGCDFFNLGCGDSPRMKIKYGYNPYFCDSHG